MMDLQPLDIPMIYGRVAIATAALTHALFATFIVGSSFIGAATETIGYATRNPRYERLSRLIAFTLIFTTAGDILSRRHPRVCLEHLLASLLEYACSASCSGRLLLEATVFLGGGVFAYAWYYSWDWAGGSANRQAGPPLFRMARRRLVTLLPC